MSEVGKNDPNIEVQIAADISKLPELPENYVRVVHLTTSEQKDSLLENGLNYEKYGMAQSMARAWSKAEEVQYWSSDPRYSNPETKVLVMDMSNEEWKLHNNLAKRPGIINKERIVGFVDTIKPEMIPNKVH